MREGRREGKRKVGGSEGRSAAMKARHSKHTRRKANAVEVCAKILKWKI